MQSAPDWWARGIAALGVGTAVWGLVLQWRGKRPSLVVRARIGDAPRLVFRDDRTDDMLYQEQLALLGTVLNDGDREILLRQAYLRPLIGKPIKVEIEWSSYPHPEKVGLAANTSYAITVFVCDALATIATRDKAVALYRLELNDKMDRWWCSRYFRISNPERRVEELRQRLIEGLPAAALQEHSALLSRARERGGPVM